MTYARVDPWPVLKAQFDRFAFTMPGWTMTLHRGDVGPWGESFGYLRLTIETIDSRGTVVHHPGMKFAIIHSYPIPWGVDGANDANFARWIRDCIERSTYHEAMEFLRRDDEVIFDPHRFEAVEQLGG